MKDVAKAYARGRAAEDANMTAAAHVFFQKAVDLFYKGGKTASLPRSKWDRLRIFRWSTPAPNVDGSVPNPWRVSDKDLALAWLKKMFDHRDIYVEYESDHYRGKVQLWVGLRDNRDRQAHHTRLLMMHDDLKKAGWPVRRARDGSYLLLADDIERDALR
jgi:hypothetical protein